MKLRPYQKQAVDFIADRFLTHNQRGFLLADPTGLGKGVQALKIAEKLMTSKKLKPLFSHILILCPSFTKPKWVEEVQTKLPKKRNYSISIKTYNNISDPAWRRLVMQHKYELVIIDESHYLKDFESLRTQSVYNSPGGDVKPILSVCRYILALTATPWPNRVGEIYPFLWAIKHKAIFNLTYEEFIAEYAEEFRFTPHGLTHRGVKNISKLKNQMSDIYLRRKKDEVLKDLPPWFRDNIEIECSSKIYKQEQELLGELLMSAGYSNFQIKTLLSAPDLLDTIIKLMPSFEKLTTFKHQQGLLKIKSVYDYLKENILIDPEQQKFILFTFHTDIVEKYRELIEKDFPALNVITITGQTDADLRFETVKEANKLKQCIAIVSMNSVKESLDFIGFDTTYFAEIDWRPYLLTQCEGRTHRIGQKKKVRWFYFIFKQGIEGYIYKMLEDKNRTIEQLQS